MTPISVYNVDTGGPCLMQISLLQFSKTFQNYLANVILGLLISLMQFFGQKSHNNDISIMNSQKIAIAKYLANAKFGPKVALSKDPMYIGEQILRK